MQLYQELKYTALTLQPHIAISPELFGDKALSSLPQIVNVAGDKIERFVGDDQPDAVTTRNGLRIKMPFNQTQTLGENDVIHNLKALFEMWDLPGIHIDNIDVTLNLEADEALLRSMYQYALERSDHDFKVPSSPQATFKLGAEEGWDEGEDGNRVPMLVVLGPKFSWAPEKDFCDIDVEPLENWRAHLPENDSRYVSVYIALPKHPQPSLFE